MELYGVPEDQKTYAAVWSYDEGIAFWFDGFQNVSRIVIFRR